MFGVHSGRIVLSVDIMLLVWTCCSQNRQGHSIFRRKVADHAH